MANKGPFIVTAGCKSLLNEQSCDNTSGLLPNEYIYLAALPVCSWSMIVTGVLGAFANIVTILVFKKMGFKEKINTSYTALAVSDMVCVIAILGAGVETLLQDHSNRGEDLGLSSLSAVLSRISCLITAWISFERCMSVVFPTRIKLLITRKVNMTVLVVIFFIVVIPPVATLISRKGATPEGTASNESSEEKEVHRVVFLMYGAVIPVSTWLCTVICTTVLVVKLRASAKWRRQVAISNQSLQTTGQQRRNMRVTKKVIVITVIFILSSAPFSACIMVRYLMRYNIISVDIALTYIIDTILMISIWLTQLNSSVNIVVFTVMGQKFRQTVRQMFTYKCC